MSDDRAAENVRPTPPRDRNGEDVRPQARPDEEALLAAFDRLSPQGSLRWGFDDAMRRIARPDTDVPTASWPGLPDDLWERGRSARIGRRFVGDVAGVMADLLASDARAAAASAAGRVHVAVWDALRYLSARVDALEAVADPVGLEAAELTIASPDLGPCAGTVGALLGPPDTSHAVVVGECGDGALLRPLREAGREVEGVEPRAASAWECFGSDGAPGTAVVMADVLDHLATVPPDSRAGTVLAGCVDRLGLAGKVALLGEGVRVTRSGRRVIVLATDQSAWEDALDPPARDLAPGRPLHPETWSLLLRRAGLVEVVHDRPVPGVLHVIAGLVP